LRSFFGLEAFLDLHTVSFFALDPLKAAQHGRQDALLLTNVFSLFSSSGVERCV